MAPLPKPKGQRVKRGPQAQWKELPADGSKVAAPKLPDRKPVWLKSTREWWQTIWESPMATVWLPADVDSLVRLASLKDDFVRGEAPTSALGAMQQLEDRFGLSPKARRALQWEISRAVEVGPVVELVKPVSIGDPRKAKADVS